MPYCPNCNRAVDNTMRFCPNCGHNFCTVSTTFSTPVYNPAMNQYSYNPYQDRSYRVVLVSTGYCSKAYARDLLEDMLGYSSADSRELLKSVPVEVCQSLTAQQAQYIAQALTEYGMQAAVCHGTQFVRLPAYTGESVFLSNGSFSPGMLGVLATLSLANRVNRIRRWNYSDPRPFLFTPIYRSPVPPPHVRRMPYPGHHRAPVPPRVAPRPPVQPSRPPMGTPRPSTSPKKPGSTTRPPSGGNRGGSSGGGSYGSHGGSGRR